MFRNLKLGVIALVASSMISTGANAATLVSDDSNFGVGSVLQDLDNNREFLRLDLTMGFGYSVITSLMGVGQTFESWSVASTAQMLALGTSAGTTHGSTDAGDIANAETLRDWFCPAGTCVNVSPSHTYARGLVSEVYAIGSQEAFTIGRRFNVSPNEVDLRISGFGGVNSPSEEVWLSRALTPVSPVPLPGAGILLIGGLAGMGLFGRRRKTA